MGSGSLGGEARGGGYINFSMVMVPVDFSIELPFPHRGSSSLGEKSFGCEALFLCSRFLVSLVPVYQLYRFPEFIYDICLIYLKLENTF